MTIHLVIIGLFFLVSSLGCNTPPYLNKVDLELSKATTLACGSLDKSKLSRAQLDPGPIYLMNFFLEFRKSPSNDFALLRCAENLGNDMLKALRAQKDTRKPVEDGPDRNFDVAIIGAGVHGAIFARNFSLKHPKKKIIIIDDSDMPAEQFHNYGFFINSPENFTDPDRDVRLKASTNIFPGMPIQLNDLYPSPKSVSPSMDKFAPAMGIWAETLFTSYFSNADFLLNTRVKSISHPNSEFYALDMNGDQIFAKKIIIGTGLGQAKWLPMKEEDKQMEIDLLAKCMRDTDCQLPQVFRSEDLFALAYDWENKKDYFLMNKLVGKDVAVIGRGDGGKIAIEYLIGQAPKISYGNVTADSMTHDVASLTWVNMPHATYAGFIADPSTKLRYKVISYEALFNKDLLKFDGSAFDPAKKINVQFIPQKAMMLDVDKNTHKVSVVYDDLSKSPPLDHVIVAIGYRNEIVQKLKSLGLAHSGLEDFSNITESFPQGSPQQPLGRKLKGEEVYFIGTVAQINDIFPSKEQLQSSKTKNSHSINVLGPLTKDLAVMDIY